MVAKRFQNPKGGLNKAGRAFFRRTTGSDLKPPVKKGDNPRRASFLARMGNMKGPEYKNGKPTRLLLSLRAWGASSKADAKKKAAAQNPWGEGATTLEWTVPSPPNFHTFEELPKFEEPAASRLVILSM